MVAVPGSNYKDLDRGKHPMDVKRHVTDLACCLIFLIMSLFFAGVYQFALMHGKPQNFYGLPTADGQICGITPAVKNQSLLYFCGAAIGDFGFKDAICVSSCDQHQACRNLLEIAGDAMSPGGFAENRSDWNASKFIPSNLTRAGGVPSADQLHQAGQQEAMQKAMATGSAGAIAAPAATAGAAAAATGAGTAVAVAPQSPPPTNPPPPPPPPTTQAPTASSPPSSPSSASTSAPPATAAAQPATAAPVSATAAPVAGAVPVAATVAAAPVAAAPATAAPATAAPPASSAPVTAPPPTPAPTPPPTTTTQDLPLLTGAAIPPPPPPTEAGGPGAAATRRLNEFSALEGDASAFGGDFSSSLSSDASALSSSVSGDTSAFSNDMASTMAGLQARAQDAQSTMADFQSRMQGLQGYATAMQDFRSGISSDSAALQSWEMKTENDFKTKSFMGMLCLPDMQSSADLAQSSLQKLHQNPNVHMLLEAKGIVDGWPILIISAVIAIVGALVYLTLLQKFTGCLLKCTIIYTVINLGAFGGYMLLVWRGVEGATLPGTGDKQRDFYIGAGCCGAAFLLVCIYCAMRETIDSAVKCLEAAAECIRESPGLLAEPFIAVTLRGTTLGFLLYGLIYLMACVKSYEASEEEILVEYPHSQYGVLAFYIFMGFWFLEFLGALSTFVVAYTVQMWWFNKRQPRAFAVTRAYAEGLLFHSGTLAMGSFLVAILRGVRLLFTLCGKAGRDSGNEEMAAAGTVGSCCANFYKDVVQKVNSFAFMDVAVNSNGFQEASVHALIVLMTNSTTAFTLHGASKIFEVAGVLFVSVVGTLSTFLIARFVPQWASPESETYIEDPLFLMIFSFLICMCVAIPFMMCLTTAADTILFCIALERTRPPPVVSGGGAPAEDSATCWIEACRCGTSPQYAKVPTKNFDECRHPEGTQKLIEHVS